jgi:hypothetical protein
MDELDQKEISSSNLGLSDNEINIKELFGVIWEGKKFIIIVTFTFAILSVVYSLSLTDHYRSDAILSSVKSQDSGMLSQYSGLASLAGVNLPSSGGDPVIEIIEKIKSREFVKHLLTFENVLPSIMAAKSYNSTSKEINFDPKIYNEKSKTWVREPTKNRGVSPTYLEAHKTYLGGILDISKDD